jgi:hypothetical protein
MATTNIQSFPGKIEVNGTTASTSTTTGALTVAGGLGVASNIHTSNLFASDYVGIGTASPTDQLDVHYPTPTYGSSVGTEEGSLTVSAGAEFSNAAVYFRTPFDAAAPAKMAIFSSGGGFSGYDGGLHFCLENTNNNTTKVNLNNSKMVVKADGNVGIGTASPQGLLHISSGTSGDAHLILEADTDDNNESDNPKIVFRQDGGYYGGEIGLRSNQMVFRNKVGDTNGGFIFYSNVNTASKTDINDLEDTEIEVMRIGGDGNVGIGTANPEASLHVQGARSIFGNNGGASDIVINDVPTARWKIATGGYALIFSKHNSASDEYSTWSEKVRIDQNGNVGIGTDSPTAQLTLGASSGSQIAVTDNTRLLSNTHYINYTSSTATDVEQVLLQFDTGGTEGADQSEYAGYIDVEMVAQRTTSGYYGPEIFTARVNYIVGWNEYDNLWRFTTFVQENKSVSAGVPDAFTVFKSVPVFKYKYVDRQLQIYVSFNANWFRGYTSFTARVTSDAPTDVSMPGSDALMASGTVGTAEIGMCYGYGAYAANVGIGTTSPKQMFEVDSSGYGLFSGRLGVGNVLTSAQNGGDQNHWDHGTAAKLLVRCTNSSDPDATYANARAYAGIALVPGFDASDTTNIGLWGTNSGENPVFYIQNQVNNGNNGGGYIALQPVGGSVGIGTTNPVAKLQVAGKSVISENISYQDGTRIYDADLSVVSEIGYSASGTADIDIGATTSQIGGYTSTYRYKLYTDVASGTSKFKIASVAGPSGTYNGYGTVTDRITLDNTGNVGIGTATPTARLTFWCDHNTPADGSLVADVKPEIGLVWRNRLVTSAWKPYSRLVQWNNQRFCIHMVSSKVI